MATSPPDALLVRYADRVWTPVVLGHSPAAVWRLDGDPPVHVKADARGGLLAEAQAQDWLGEVGFPAPRTVAVATDGRWLVSTTVPGRPASDPWPAARRPAVVAALVAATERFHALPVDACPFEPVATTGPAGLVVTHGDWCLPNVLFDPDTLTLTGVVDTGRLAPSDRLRDIALMSWSLHSRDLNPQFGSVAAQYLRGCRVAPDDPRLDTDRWVQRSP